MNGDVVSMLGNLSRALFPVETLISGLGYLIGIIFMVTGLMKMKAVGSGGHSNEKIFVPLMYFVGGSALIFLPSMLTSLSKTAFGSGNILQYIPYNPYNIYNSMGILIQTAGLIWFVRGCMLIVHGSSPGVKEGTKGLAFIGAGILAVNFQETYGALSYIAMKLLSITGIVQSSV